MRNHAWMHITLWVTMATASTLASGCALRTGRTEHYIGPTFFRLAQPPQAQAYVTQVVQLGVAAEAGTQWGLSLGVVDRIAVAPYCNCAESDTQGAKMEWSTPLGPFELPPAGRWGFSLLYLRAVNVPKPEFVRRALFGAAALAGSEVTAVSVGVTTRTRTSPRANAVSLLSFDARHPLETRFNVWPAGPGQRLPVETILKEVTR